MKISRQSSAWMFCLFVALLICSCDSGIALRPIEWTQTSDISWRIETESLELELSPPVTVLSGSESLAITLRATNPTSEVLEIDGAKLAFGVAGVEAGEFFDSSKRVTSLRAGEKKDVVFYFSLGRPLAEILVSPVQMDIHYRLSSQDEQVLPILLSAD